jgi:hypothetical protein
MRPRRQQSGVSFVFAVFAAFAQVDGWHFKADPARSKKWIEPTELAEATEELSFLCLLLFNCLSLSRFENTDINRSPHYSSQWDV